MLLKSGWLRDFADLHSCMPSRGGTMEEPDAQAEEQVGDN
jgi:hypothetical protein